MNFVKELVAALTATTLVAVSGLSSVCMAVRDNRDFAQTVIGKMEANEYYALKMLGSISKDEGLKKSDKDGNYFKLDELNSEEKETYNEIIGEVNKIKGSIPKDNDYEINLARAIFFWIRNNIKYDETSVNLGYDKDGFQIVNPNRKPQDALTVFKNKEGICVGVANLAVVFMREAGLSCILVCNYDHQFNAVWIESLAGWALFDATCTEEMKAEELAQSQNTKSKISSDIIGMENNFTAVCAPKRYPLKEDNGYFMSRFGMNHHVYIVGDPVTKFGELGVNFSEVSYIPQPKFMEIESENKSITIDENLISINDNCKIYGNIEEIRNFDVFIKNFVKVDASNSHIKKTLQKDGVEFNLSCDGKQSKLSIKPLNGSVSCDTVTIPDELVPFLADIDVFDVHSSIKTVKYDLLREDHVLKQSAAPSGVKFEQITL